MIVYHFYRQLESNLKRIHEAFRRRKLLLPLGSAFYAYRERCLDTVVGTPQRSSGLLSPFFSSLDVVIGDVTTGHLDITFSAVVAVSCTSRLLMARLATAAAVAPRLPPRISRFRYRLPDRQGPQDLPLSCPLLLLTLEAAVIAGFSLVLIVNRTGVNTLKNVSPWRNLPLTNTILGTKA